MDCDYLVLPMWWERGIQSRIPRGTVHNNAQARRGVPVLGACPFIAVRRHPCGRSVRVVASVSSTCGNPARRGVPVLGACPFIAVRRHPFGRSVRVVASVSSTCGNPHGLVCPGCTQTLDAALQNLDRYVTPRGIFSLARFVEALQGTLPPDLINQAVHSVRSAVCGFLHTVYVGPRSSQMLTPRQYTVLFAALLIHALSASSDVIDPGMTFDRQRFERDLAMDIEDTDTNVVNAHVGVFPYAVPGDEFVEWVGKRFQAKLNPYKAKQVGNGTREIASWTVTRRPKSETEERRCTMWSGMRKTRFSVVCTT